MPSHCAMDAFVVLVFRRELLPTVRTPSTAQSTKMAARRGWLPERSKAIDRAKQGSVRIFMSANRVPVVCLFLFFLLRVEKSLNYQCASLRALDIPWVTRFKLQIWPCRYANHVFKFVCFTLFLLTFTAFTDEELKWGILIKKPLDAIKFLDERFLQLATFFEAPTAWRCQF